MFINKTFKICAIFVFMTADFPENEIDKIVCEACGEEFSCGANAEKCWCFAVELKAEILAELQKNFNRCLCANCLGKLSASEVNL